jgi:hypothetical protein
MHLVPNQTHRIRITVDNVVPKSLVFYVFGSVLNAFIDWKKNENVEIMCFDIDKFMKDLVHLLRFNLDIFILFPIDKCI